MGKNRLGKSLDFLLKTNSQDEIDMKAVEILQISTKDIFANTYQPRKNFDEEKLNDLVASIKEKGIIEPLIVRKQAGKFELVCGERRWRAAQVAGLSLVPAIEKDFTDKEMVEVSIIENVQREDLNPIEKAMAYQNLISMFDLTQEDASFQLGIRRSSLANFIRLLKLPKAVQDLVSRGTLSMGHARALLSLENDKEMESLAKQVVAHGMSVREIEKQIQTLTKSVNSNASSKGGKKSGTPGHIIELQEDLQEKLGTKVKIVEKKGTGSIKVEFYSKDDFDRIYKILKSKA